MNTSDSKSEKLPLSVTGKYAPSYSENRNAPRDKDTNDHGTNKQKLEQTSNKFCLSWHQ